MSKLALVMWTILLGLGARAAPPAQDLVELGKKVEKRISKLRGLPSRKPIRWEMTTKEKVRRYLLEMMEKQYAPGEIEAEGDALKALGLIPASMDYKEFMLALIEEQAGGYYDPRKETFYLADWIAPALQETIIAHELTHALQDQHFGIDEFIDRIKGNSDVQYARLAVVEGEATLVMMADAMRTMGAEIDLSLVDFDGPMGQMMMSLSAAQMPRFAEAPPALQRILMFPYLQGLKFVSSGKREGGWGRIDKVYRDLPASTEQILHPEKYFTDRDPPEKISLAGQADAVPAGWKQIQEDVLGEFGTLLLLAPVGEKSEERRAAAGWDGDLVRVYKRGRDLAWIQLSAWDSEQDAVEFAGAFAKTVPARRPGFAQQPVTAEPRMVWKNAEGQVVLVEKRANRVLVVEGFGEAAANALRDAAFR